MRSDGSGSTQVAEVEEAVRGTGGRFTRAAAAGASLPPRPYTVPPAPVPGAANRSRRAAPEPVRTTEAARERARWRGIVATAAIAASMLVVTVVMCAAVPAGAFYLVFGAYGAQPGPVAYLLVMLGVVLGVVPCMKALVLLQRRQCELTASVMPRARSGWMKSLCDDRGPRDASLLDTVVTWVMIVVLLGAAVYYFGFAAWAVPPT